MGDPKGGTGHPSVGNASESARGGCRQVLDVDIYGFKTVTAKGFTEVGILHKPEAHFERAVQCVAA